MKAPCILILAVIQLSTTTDCCSLEMNMTVDNAFISCPTNWSCTAECYRGFIFPGGSRKEYYSCQNREWTPMLPSCKRNPLVFVHYSAIWRITEVLPSICPNISTRLDTLKDMLEKTLAESCQTLDVNATVQFTYSFLSFQVKAQFTAVYRNFTNRQSLDVCISYNILSFNNQPIIRTLFNGVTCRNLSLSNTIIRTLFVSDVLESCDDSMEIHNVTTEPGQFELFCDVKDKMTTINTPILRKSSSSITTVNDDMVTSDFSNMHQTSTGVFSKQATIINSEWKTSIYILAPAAAVFLMLCVAIILVRLRKRAQAQKREKSYETIITGGQTQYINMEENTHNYDVIGYRRERRQQNRS